MHRTGRRAGERATLSIATAAVAAILLAGCGAAVSGTAQPGVTVPTAASSIASVAPPPTSSASPPTQITTPETTAAAPSTDTSTETSTDTSTDTSGETSAGTELPPDTSSTPTTRSSPEKWLLPDPSDDYQVNEFDDVVGKVGTSYGLTQKRAGKTVDVVVFRVTSIRVDKGCPSPAKATNGHLVVIGFDVELRNISVADAVDNNAQFGNNNWTAYDADGTPETGVDSEATTACAGDRAMGRTDDFRLGAINSGLVVLDVSSPSGTVVLTTAGISDGWEYRYG